MYTIIRDLDPFSKVSIDPHLPVFCDIETCVDEGLSSGGLYGKTRLFQIFQEPWDKAIIIDCLYVPLLSVLDLLQPHFLVFHGGAFDVHTVNLKTKETWLPRDLGDTLYLSRLTYFTKQRFDFYRCLEYAEESDSLIQGINKKEEQKSNWSGPLSLKQKTYAAADVIYLAKLYNKVKHMSESTIYRLDIQNLKYAIDYSRNGMPINQDTVLNFKKEYTIKLEHVLDDLPINPLSPKQSCEYLGTSSSASEVLTELVYDGNERAKKIKDARHYAKSIGYLNAYDRPVIKGFFQPSAALTGRFSCTGGNSYSHVNLQQIPETLHSVVEVPEGYRIVYKDYSGLELRMAVAYVGEPMMGQLMKSGLDMHLETSKEIFEKDDITELERTIAKVFNFGLIYGAGIGAIQSTLKDWANLTLPFGEVKQRVQRWFGMYEYFSEWHEIHKRQFNVYGYVDVETALGRKVRTYKLTDSLNWPIQGSSVEVTKTSLGLLFSRYPDAYLMNTIHDANILLAKEEEADMWGKRLSECMVDAWNYVIANLADPDVPMPHGYKLGTVWDWK